MKKESTTNMRNDSRMHVENSSNVTSIWTMKRRFNPFKFLNETGLNSIAFSVSAKKLFVSPPRKTIYCS